MGRLLVWVCGSVEGLGGGTASTAGNGGGHSNTLSSGTLSYIGGAGKLLHLQQKRYFEGIEVH